MRLCIACGTFNPVHVGHVALWRYVLEHFEYDRLLVIPSYKTPIKNGCIDAQHRYNMTELAVKELLGAEISPIEFEREDTSYTYFTVKELYKRYEIEGKIGFVTGADAYLTLDSWFECDKLKEMLDFIVFERESHLDDKKVREMVKKGYNKINAGMEPVDVSSSLIREKIASGEDIEGLVPSKVKEYIVENELYKF